MDFQMGEITHYYAWCRFPDCGYITSDSGSEKCAEADMGEHWAEEHEPIHDDVGDGRCKCGVDGRCK
jgi:hypothetical protein